MFLVLVHVTFFVKRKIALNFNSLFEHVPFKVYFKDIISES